MNKEIGNVAGVSIIVNPETYEDIKKRKTIYENEILIELQTRIDKAIEYITYEWFKREQIGISHLSFSYDELQHILDILRGEDNESKGV